MQPWDVSLEPWRGGSNIKSTRMNSSQFSEGNQEMGINCQRCNVERTFQDGENKRKTKNPEPGGFQNKAIIVGNKQEMLMFVFTHRCVSSAQISGLGDLSTVMPHKMNRQEWDWESPTTKLINQKIGNEYQ